MKDSTKELLSSALTWTLRVAVGVVFIFSGITKGIDPWGTLFKFQDYSAAMGISIWSGLLTAGVFALCAVEFIVGVFLLTGCCRRSTPIVAALFMAVMLPLTLWIALADPVSDCGCFGDALKISNWHTFWKNVCLSVAIIWLLRFNRRSACLVNPYIQWMAIVVSGIYILAISLFGYSVQPLLDFRSYPEGDTLIDDDGDSDDNTLESMQFIYSKDGEERAFTADNIPDENMGWKFVERRMSTGNNVENESLHGAAPAPSRAFRIWSGDEDISEEVASEEKSFILMIPDIKNVSVATTWKINSLYSWCEIHGIDMFAVAGGNSDEIEKWKDLALAEYPIYTAEDTAIKEVVRGNPGLVFIQNGVIRWKISLRAIDIDDFMSPHTSSDPAEFAFDYQAILRNITLIYIAAMLLLCALSFSPSIARFFYRKSAFRGSPAPLSNNQLSDKTTDAPVEDNGDLKNHE